MELVYLWVEKYKNIRNQGFNFSPRFECEFKPEYKQKGNNKNSLSLVLKNTCKLNILIKENYSKDFFADNINITAIVGKNGTGKSKIMKFLYSTISKNENSFAIFSDKERNLFYLGNNYVPKYIKNAKNIREVKKLPTDTIFTLFDYSLTYDNELNYIDNFIYPKKQVNSLKGAILLAQESTRNQKNILLNHFTLKDNNQLNKFNDFFQPKIIKIIFDKSVIEDKYKLEKTHKESLENLKEKIINKMKFKDFIDTLKRISELLNSEDFYIKKQFKIANPKPFFQDIFKLGNIESQIDEQNNLWHKNFKKTHTNIFNNNLIKQIEMHGLIDESTKFEILSLEIDNLNKELIEILLTSFDHNYFEIDLIDKNEKKLSDLSFGEQQLLFILNQLYSLKDEIIEDQNIILNNFVVLLDEIDIGFHPDWQKKAISFIIDFLKFIPEKNFHLIFTTHSPFILSDIPNKNVIFLDKFAEEETKNKYPTLDIKDLKDGNCINVSKHIELKTFGANIHTLLSDGFFMSDGLMGEFAKSKITEIKEFYKIVKNSKNPKEEHKKEFEDNIKSFIHIQSIIGEPFLQTIIKNYLDDLYLIFSDDKTLIDKELSELENRKKYLESLKNAKN